MGKIFLALTLMFGALSFLCGIFCCISYIGSISKKINSAKVLVFQKIRDSIPDNLDEENLSF